MRANFDDSYRELAPAAARLLRLLGLHPGGDIAPAAAAALADVPESRARELLDTLAARGLVTESGGRFRLPGPVRGYARELAGREDTAADRDAAERRVLDHHLGAAAAGEAALDAEGLALLERQRWTEAAETLEEDLRLAERLGDRHTVLLARLNLAGALTRTDAADRAIDLLSPLPDAFAALPEPDRYNRARALSGLAEAHLRAHRPAAAIDFFDQALEVLRGADADGEEPPSRPR